MKNSDVQRAQYYGLDAIRGKQEESESYRRHEKKEGNLKNIQKQLNDN